MSEDTTKVQANGYSIGDDVWKRVIQFLQMCMLSGHDIGDHLRSIRVVLNVSGGECNLAPGQDELLVKEIEQLERLVDEQIKNESNKNLS